MNKRIKELAAQARKYADDNEEHWKEGPSWDSLFEEKFAELLIRKCADVADESDATRHKYEGIGKYVREHFGIQGIRDWIII